MISNEDEEVVRHLATLENGEEYTIRMSPQPPKMTEIEMILKRKVHPLCHPEAMIGIKNMMRGSNLLKHLNSGYPHIRFF